MVKRTTRKKTNRSTPTKPLPGWVWMLTGLIVGLSATFLPTINEVNNKEEDSIAIESPVEPESKRTFDFYTLLPELEVVVDKNNQNEGHSKTKLPDGEYVLQVGSFKNHEEADSLKAQLALMGVETNIEIVKVNTINWHRVRVGPNKDIVKLQSIQKRLLEKRMDSILLKVRS